MMRGILGITIFRDVIRQWFWFVTVSLMKIIVESYHSWPKNVIQGKPCIIICLKMASRVACVVYMMTSSNGNIFRVTGHLCGDSPAQRPLTRSFDVLFDLRLNKRLSKQSGCWWFKTPSHPLWRHCNGILVSYDFIFLKVASWALGNRMIAPMAVK